MTFLDGMKTNRGEVVFKFDTGAEVMAVSETVYQSLRNISLRKPTRSLVRPAQEPVYVVRNLNSNLLGLPAILALNLIVKE